MHILFTMPRVCDFPVFDADNHFYETRDSFTRHLPDRYKGAIDYVELRGRTKIMIRGTVSEYIPNPTFEVVARPGAQEEYFRNGNPEGKSYREVIGEPMRSIPAFQHPEPRIEVMNELGVDRSLMFPTLASLLEERMRDDPELTHAAIHSLNEWMYEEWQFNYEDRIFATPVITLPIVEKAIEELEWCVERGAKTVLIRPAPVPGFRGSRSFGYPEFDPFWQAVVDADILVSMHSSDSGYARYTSDWTGPERDAALPARLVHLHDRRPPADSGHHGGVRLPRRVRPLPRPPRRLHRGRRGVDPGVRQPPRRHLQEDAERLRRRPGRSSSSTTSTSARSTRTTWGRSST